MPRYNTLLLEMIFLLTASVKTTKTKILGTICVILALIIGTILFFAGKGPEEAAESISRRVTNNEERREYLALKGVETAPEPSSVEEVLLPKNDAVFKEYCEKQKAAGYDISSYLGKKAVRYVYPVKGTEEVYAALYVCDEKIIAADVASYTEGWQKPVDGNQNIG
ncbi:MAG: DUF4830 domain-containing protein [Ruminococcaceae bacterium]|nr:DUF4830 domain-containing protein [Oscillospiraceae bacterium]